MKMNLKKYTVERIYGKEAGEVPNSHDFPKITKITISA